MTPAPLCATRSPLQKPLAHTSDAQKRVPLAPRASFIGTRAGLLQRTCACGGTSGFDGECEACRKKRLAVQRHPAGPAVSADAPPIVYDVLREPGQPLDVATRASMELRFGHDFSRVRVHTDARAGASSEAVNAQAYAVGRHVVFGPGQYAPHSQRGLQLLTHELAHVVQQGTDAALPAVLPISASSDVAEHDADDAAAATAAGGIEHLSAGHAPIIARQEKPSPLVSQAPRKQEGTKASSGGRRRQTAEEIMAPLYPGLVALTAAAGRPTTAVDKPDTGKKVTTLTPGGDTPTLYLPIAFGAKANLPFPSMISLLTPNPKGGKLYFTQNIRKIVRGVDPCSAGAKKLEAENKLDTSVHYSKPVDVPGPGSRPTPITIKTSDVPMQSPCGVCDFTSAPTFIFAHDEFRMFVMYEEDLLSGARALGYIDWMWEALGSFKKIDDGQWVHGLVAGHTPLVKVAAAVLRSAPVVLDDTFSAEDLCPTVPTEKFE